MKYSPLIAVLAFVLAPSFALSEDISGNYAVSGIEPSGSRYVATATITMTGSQTAEMAMHLSHEKLLGRCILTEENLACFSDLGGGVFSMAVYRRGHSGTFEGIWVHSGLKGKGQETLTPQP